MTQSSFKYYIEDVFSQILDSALELKKQDKDEFDTGRLFAHYEILSTLLRQAEAFDINREILTNYDDQNLEELINPGRS